MTITRRELVKLGAGASAALFLDKLPAFARTPAMLMREIPSSGERIPAVGLGTRSFYVQPDGAPLADLREVLRLFHALGGKLVDTAPSYGDSERTIGEQASTLGITHELFFATKVSTRNSAEWTGQIESSFQLLGTHRIDLMQVHNAQRFEPSDLDAVLGILREWRAEGRFRYVGITTSSVQAYGRIEEIMRSETLDFVQLRYSLGTRAAEERLLPTAADRGMAVLVNLPYERGRLFRLVGERELPEWAADFSANTWGQFFLKYLLGDPAVTCVIPATTNPHHLEDNMGAGEGVLPTDEQRGWMVDYYNSLS